MSPWGVHEKEVSLAVSKRLQTLLAKETGVEVVLTRQGDDDVQLADRTKIANLAHADVMISIHCNSMPTRAARAKTEGIETYFLSADASDERAEAVAALENADVGEATAGAASDPIANILQDISRTEAHADSEKLAEDVHSGLIHTLHTRDRGIRQAPFIVLLGADMPAILVEIGFISNPAEGKRLADPTYQDRIATALRDAILQFRDTVVVKRKASPKVEPAAAPGH